MYVFSKMRHENKVWEVEMYFKGVKSNFIPNLVVFQYEKNKGKINMNTGSFGKFLEKEPWERNLVYDKEQSELDMEQQTGSK